MKPSLRTLAISLISLTLALAGCRREADFSPPQILLGQTECDLCKMIVSEEPYAAAAVFESPEGMKKLAFDDIGCLLRFLRQSPHLTHVACYVHDHATRDWLNAVDAVFVLSDKLQTPMASSLCASATETAAQEILKKYPGRTFKFLELTATSLPDPTTSSVTSERSSP